MPGVVCMSNLWRHLLLHSSYYLLASLTCVHADLQMSRLLALVNATLLAHRACSLSELGCEFRRWEKTGDPHRGNLFECGPEVSLRGVCGSQVSRVVFRPTRLFHVPIQ